MSGPDAGEPFVRGVPGGVILHIRVQPRASRVSVGPAGEGELLIRLTAPPVDNAANRQCIQVLAEALKIRSHQVSVLSGHKGRNKRIRVDGVAVRTVVNSLGL